MHNRWNPELNVQAVPGYTQLLRASDGRLAERCLWTGRIALPDTWESVTLLCVPLLDSAGNVRGICGAELSDLYFRLTYPAVDSAYGSMVTVLAPIDGDRLLLGQAMIGSPGGSYLTADGTLTCKTGRYYNTYSDGSRTYLGLHEPIGATDAAGRKLAAVVLVPEIGLRTLEARSRMVWIAGSLVFLAAMLLLSTYLSRRFVTPISRSLQAIREQTPGEHPSGISEIDELLAFVRSRAAEQLTAGGLPAEHRGAALGLPRPGADAHPHGAHRAAVLHRRLLARGGRGARVHQYLHRQKAQHEHQPQARRDLTRGAHAVYRPLPPLRPSR